MAHDDNGLPPPPFFEEAAKHCDCCEQCSSFPCDGCCAGGICDRAPCRCDDDAPEWAEDDDL